MDLFQADAGAISSGNMRNGAAESVNEAVQFHNSELAKQAQGMRQAASDALSQQRIEQGISNIMSGFMEARGLKSGIQSYKDYVAQGRSKAAALQEKAASLQNQMGNTGAEIRNNPAPAEEPVVEARPNTTDEQNAPATPEAPAAQGTTDKQTKEAEQGANTAGYDGSGKTGAR